MEIMKLIPTGKDYLWGGTRLREEYGKKIDLTPLAETWECSVHPDGPSYVANGIYKGNTLAEVLKIHPEYLGTKVENGELPVLVKFIDAKKDVSVQVHPSDEYAREHEGDNGKTEMWYVIDADEHWRGRDCASQAVAAGKAAAMDLHCHDRAAPRRALMGPHPAYAGLSLSFRSWLCIAARSAIAFWDRDRWQQELARFRSGLDAAI